MNTKVRVTGAVQPLVRDAGPRCELVGPAEIARALGAKIVARETRSTSSRVVVPDHVRRQV